MSDTMGVMHTIRTILVPTDFSKHAQHALMYAASLGERFGTDIHLLHVVTLQGYGGQTDLAAFPDLEPYLERADKVARERLDAGALHGGTAEAKVFKALTRAVSAPEAIVEYAERKKADLVVIATRGNTGLTHVLLGSVTERVIRYAPCPVLVVGGGDRDYVDPDTGVVRIRRVVVADDFSDSAAAALRYAVEHLRPYKPEVCLAHAVVTDVPPAYAFAGVDSIFQLRPDLKDRLIEMLRKRAAEVVPDGWAISCEVREGKPHEVVPRYARDVEADLLVVGRETKIELAERVFGGASERIVRHAPCPALVA
jgi:nucleotide-binding universal stress UspA family protein